jgi:hypothetical protein
MHGVAGASAVLSPANRRFANFAVWPACALLLIAGWAFSSSGLLTVDEYFYVRAAESMAREGAFDFRQFDVDGAPALDMSFAAPAQTQGRLTPQYPAGYAIIASPFFFLFGIKGLALMNALAAGATLLFTFRIARRLGADAVAATLSCAILAFGSYWSSFAFAIWPHMLALAVVLGAIERLLAAGEGSRRAAFAAGALIGIGETIRIDMIALAPAAILWLRFFCEGQTRTLAGAFAFGLLPALGATAVVAYVKSGRIDPFTYENGLAANDPTMYAPLAVVGAALAASALVFDLRSLALRADRMTIALIALILAALAFPTVLRLLHGYWYALVDAQSYRFVERQPGVERDAWGWLSFYGLSKKALAQSLPFLPLLIAPAARFFAGRMSRGEGLVFLAAGAFATLYAYNETDSGLGLNSRFLLPLVPLACVLAAIELQRVSRSAKLSRTSLALFALAGMSGFGVLRTAIPDPGRHAVPMDLYPQLALAALLAVAVTWNAVNSASAARAAALLGALAVGAGAAIGADDLFLEQSYRRYVERQSALYQSLVPDGSLVLTTRPILFAAPMGRRIGVAYPGLAPRDEEAAAISAFRKVGRCVIAHGETAIAAAEHAAGEPFLPISLGPEFMQGPIAASPGAACPPEPTAGA